MSRLDELIPELCPDGVKYKALEDIAYVTMGTSPSGDMISSDPLQGIEFHQGKSCFENVTLGHSNTFTSSPVKEAKAGSIVMSVRAPVGDTNITDRRIAIGRGLCAILGKGSMVTKFIYYYLNAFIEEVKKKSTGSTFKSINTNDVKSIRIPTPPLPVQREIVRILDNFTELTVELTDKLTAELTARKKQYSYYRDLLFGFAGQQKKGVNWMPLSQICINHDSKRKPIKKSERSVGRYPYYGASGIIDYIDDYLFDGDYLLVSEDGANLLARNSPIAFSVSGKVWVNNHAHVLEFDSYATRKFVEIYLNSIKLGQFISVAAQPKLTQDNLNKIPIPIPSYAEQQRIVSILDRFDALVNDLTSGLPAEIEARRKQYEYYRDKLLTFKEVGT